MNVSLAAWNEFLSQYPNTHFLQTGAWGELKSRFGWKVIRIINGNSGAQLLFRPLPLGYSIGYLAKGPVGDAVELYEEVEIACREHHAVFLKLEPHYFEDSVAAYIPLMKNLVASKPIQPRRTVIVSLAGTEDEILNRMKQKTRYNIHLAEKKEVVVRPSIDVDEFHKMAQVTAQRDAFGVHNLAYYQAVYDLLHTEGSCELLTAYYGNQPLAALFVVAGDETAYYLYGASYDLERNRMPTYLIQWEAMKWAKQRGCLNYDLWGIPDLDEQELEGSFQEKHSHDGLWGVYRFKRGFGGEVRRSVGAWDKIYHKGIYRLYEGYVNLRGGQGD